ncbi:MAG: GTPase Era [Candidatus Glassbacteria bacterium]
MSHRVGYVAICGLTNVGKSTLLNRILGEKLAIVSKKPQTTRTRITGIKNMQDVQIVFLDSPGLHAGHSSLDRFMLEQAKRVLYESQVILLMVDAKNTVEYEWKYLAPYASDIRVPIILLINKIDVLKSRDEILPLIEEYAKAYSFAEVIPISALTGDGIDTVVECAVSLLPEGPPLFPTDMLSDLPEKVIASEIVREKTYQLLHQEIPYSVAVVVENFQEKKERDILLIEATLFVERESQKAIVIGRKGQMLKEIGKRARIELESFFGIKVYLSLWVKVEKNWSRKLKSLQKMGYYR